MGKTSNSGFSHGTNGSPQTSIDQEQLKNIIKENEENYLKNQEEIKNKRTICS